MTSRTSRASRTVEDINPYALPDNLHPADVPGGGRK